MFLPLKKMPQKQLKECEIFQRRFPGQVCDSWENRPPRRQKPSEGAVWLLAAFNRSLAAAAASAVSNFVQCWPQGEPPHTFDHLTNRVPISLPQSRFLLDLQKPTQLHGFTCVCRLVCVSSNSGPTSSDSSLTATHRQPYIQT